jgi:hypothetical protein
VLLGKGAVASADLTYRAPGNAVGIASAAPEGAPVPDTEEMPTAGVDPLTQAILCVGGLVPAGADPVIVLLDEVAIFPL